MPADTAPSGLTRRAVRRGPHRAGALLLAAALVAALAGCADGDRADAPADAGADPTADAAAGQDGIAVAVASFDLAVGPDRRLMAVLFTPERRLIGHGTVTFALGHLGDEPGGEAELTERAEAPFLAVPGMTVDPSATTPRELDDPLLAGVYAARVELDRPGYWGLRVEVELGDGRTVSGRTVFRVLAEEEAVAVGDPAPTVHNLTTADVVAGRAEGRALDSRLQGTQTEDPAPTLHATTVADAVAAGRPVVVVIATPVYCQSRVCGPLTDTMEVFAAAWQDRVDVVHLEVWEDFEAQRLNEAAAAWIQTGTGGNEPWVYLVGADGRVVARWDNVLDLAELEALVAALPVIGPR